MMKNKVSVIIPVYNGVAWIRECIESVLVQTFQNFEIIVLDDHSTDGTTEAVQRLTEGDDRIRLILRNSKGVSGARNEGIAQSDGEYITFLDADDKLDQRMLETLIGCLQKENSDMISCGYYRWTVSPKDAMQSAAVESETGVENTGRNAAEEKINVRTVDREHYLSDYLLRQHTHCWGVLYKRSVIENVGFREDLTIGEDMMFLMDLLPKLERVSITDYKGYYYRMNEAGATLRPFIPAYMDEIKSWKLAADMVKRDYPQYQPQIESILAVSGILVAGKISRLPSRDRKKYRNYVEECRETVENALKVQGAKENLPAGYGLKTVLFMRCPWIYLRLYHLWKSR